MNLLVVSQFLVDGASDLSIDEAFRVGECDAVLLLEPVKCDALGSFSAAQIHRQEIGKENDLAGHARATRRAMLQFFKRTKVEGKCLFTFPCDNEAFFRQVCQKLPKGISVGAVVTDEPDERGSFTKISLEDSDDTPMENFFLSKAIRYGASQMVCQEHYQDIDGLEMT